MASACADCDDYRMGQVVRTWYVHTGRGRGASKPAATRHLEPHTPDPEGYSVHRTECVASRLCAECRWPSDKTPSGKSNYQVEQWCNEARHLQGGGRGPGLHTAS